MKIVLHFVLVVDLFEHGIETRLHKTTAQARNRLVSA